MWIGARRSIAASPGAIASTAATNPFMSQAPRPISRPPSRRRRNGSARPPGSSAGTTSAWPDRM